MTFFCHQSLPASTVMGIAKNLMRAFNTGFLVKSPRSWSSIFNVWINGYFFAIFFIALRSSLEGFPCFFLLRAADNFCFLLAFLPCVEVLQQSKQNDEENDLKYHVCASKFQSGFDRRKKRLDFSTKHCTFSLFWFLRAFPCSFLNEFAQNYYQPSCKFWKEQRNAPY